LKILGYSDGEIDNMKPLQVYNKYDESSEIINCKIDYVNQKLYVDTSGIDSTRLAPVIKDSSILINTFMNFFEPA
jgi:hypothetical protein